MTGRLAQTAAIAVVVLLLVARRLWSRRVMDSWTAGRYGGASVVAFASMWLWTGIAYPAPSSGVATPVLLAASAFVLLAYLSSRRPSMAGLGLEEKPGRSDEDGPAQAPHQLFSGEERGSGAALPRKPSEAVGGLGHDLTLRRGRQRVREIRIEPGEEIVVENGRIIVREMKT